MCAITASTTSPTLIAVVSIVNASAAGTNGDTARPRSRASRASMSLRRAPSRASKSVATGCERRDTLPPARSSFNRRAVPCSSCNCKKRRLARACALAVRKIFTSASGNTTVPISRPSATKPGARRNPCWLASRAARTFPGRGHDGCGGADLIVANRQSLFDPVDEHGVVRKRNVQFGWEDRECATVVQVDAAS